MLREKILNAMSWFQTGLEETVCFALFTVVISKGVGERRKVLVDATALSYCSGLGYCAPG